MLEIIQRIGRTDILEKLYKMRKMEEKFKYHHLIILKHRNQYYTLNPLCIHSTLLKPSHKFKFMTYSSHMKMSNEYSTIGYV